MFSTDKKKDVIQDIAKALDCSKEKANGIYGIAVETYPGVEAYNSCLSRPAHHYLIIDIIYIVNALWIENVKMADVREIARIIRTIESPFLSLYLIKLQVLKLTSSNQYDKDYVKLLYDIAASQGVVRADRCQTS